MDIYDHYIKTSAERELNVSNEAKNACEADIMNLSITNTLFNDLFTEVSFHMGDIFRRFSSSDESSHSNSPQTPRSKDSLFSRLKRKLGYTERSTSLPTISLRLPARKRQTQSLPLMLPVCTLEDLINVKAIENFLLGSLFGSPNSKSDSKTKQSPIG